MCFRKGYNFQLVYNLYAGIGFSGYWNKKSAIKLLVSPHIIVAKTSVQEVIALHRMNTDGIELHFYPQGWVKTIKIVKIY